MDRLTDLSKSTTVSGQFLIGKKYYFGCFYLFQMVFDNLLYNVNL